MVWFPVIFLNLISLYFCYWVFRKSFVWIIFFKTLVTNQVKLSTFCPRNFAGKILRLSSLFISFSLMNISGKQYFSKFWHLLLSLIYEKISRLSNSELLHANWFYIKNYRIQVPLRKNSGIIAYLDFLLSIKSKLQFFFNNSAKTCNVDGYKLWGRHGTPWFKSNEVIRDPNNYFCDKNLSFRIVDIFVMSTWAVTISGGINAPGPQ